MKVSLRQKPPPKYHTAQKAQNVYWLTLFNHITTGTSHTTSTHHGWSWELPEVSKVTPTSCLWDTQCWLWNFCYTYLQCCTMWGQSYLCTLCGKSCTFHVSCSATLVSYSSITDTFRWWPYPYFYRSPPRSYHRILPDSVRLGPIWSDFGLTLSYLVGFGWIWSDLVRFGLIRWDLVGFWFLVNSVGFGRIRLDMVCRGSFLFSSEDN